MMLRTPLALETQATLPPVGAAVNAVGKEEPRTWSRVKGADCADAASEIARAVRIRM